MIQERLAEQYNGDLLYLDITENPGVPYEVEFTANNQQIVANFVTSYFDADDKFIAIYRCTIVSTGAEHAIVG